MHAARQVELDGDALVLNYGKYELPSLAYSTALALTSMCEVIEKAHAWTLTTAKTVMVQAALLRAAYNADSDGVIQHADMEQVMQTLSEFNGLMRRLEGSQIVTRENSPGDYGRDWTDLYLHNYVTDIRV
jgi:hypothetical protein